MSHSAKLVEVIEVYVELGDDLWYRRYYQKDGQFIGELTNVEQD